MAAGATSRVTVAPFVAERDEPPPGRLARMASTLQIASGGRLILGIGIGGAPKEHAAYGIDFPRRRRSASPGSRRRSRSSGPCGPAARSPGRRRSTRSTTPSPIPVPDPAPRIIVGGETAGRGPAGRPRSATAGRRSTTTSSRTCRSTSRRSRRPAGDARTRPCSSGSRASWLGDESIRDTPWFHDPARDLGALARGRRRWRDRPRADDRRRRRARGRRRPLVAHCDGPAGFVAPSRGDPDHTAPRSAAPARPSRPTRAPAAARRSAPASGCASAATRSGCATRRPRRSTGRCSWRSRRDRAVLASWRACRSPGIGPFPATSTRRDADRRTACAVTLTVTNEGSRPARRPAGSCDAGDGGVSGSAFVLSPRIEPRRDRHASRPSSPQFGPGRAAALTCRAVTP